MKKIIFIVLAVLLFVGTLGWLFLKGIKKDTVYETTTMTKEDIKKRTMATGKIVPRKEVAIKPQSISGIIEELYVKEGQIVKKGDKIAKVSIIPNEVNLNSAMNRVNVAQINYNNALKNYNRDKDLFTKGVIASVEFEKTEVSYLNAKEELEGAKSNLQITKTGALSGNKSSNTTIRSTIDGMILQIPVKIGNSVIASNNFNDGTTIASVADMDEIIFEGKIDETDVAKLYIGMPVELTIGAVNNEKFEATLEHIAPKGNDDGGAVKFEIKAKVNLKEGQAIRAGYSANADIVLDKRDSVYTLKESYLTFRNDSIFVEVLKPGGEKQQFEERPIETGLSDGINVEILDGLSPEEEVKAGVKKD
ncbi:HlyD family secretion protein [Balneicella halophila]|uniref:HlyD family secretion protein n=1 Tax=Balneicella halophila TaxID=1537566 RepID=A0A7L4UQR1_BALHA|nr:efflux RND transporter periplasmic adaptor subunit [Balneicella halophila]PVX51852.1 HlyD family secretion protein [Balneicella halophila]